MRVLGLGLIVAGLLSAVRAEGTPSALPMKAHATTDKSEIHIGERLTYTVRIEIAGEAIPDLPELPKQLGKFDVLDVRQEPPVLRKDETLATVICTLTSYETGKQFIPAAEISYKRKDGVTCTVMTNDVPVEVLSVLAPDEKMEDIRDIKEILPFAATSDMLLLLVGILLIVLLIGVFALSRLTGRRDAQEEAPRALAAHEIALAELEKLRNSGMIAAGQVREFYYRLSHIARQYIESRFDLRAPERTTEEFLFEAADVDLLLAAHRSLLSDFLAHCDLVKYAKHTPTSIEVRDACAAAEKFIQETKQAPEDERGSTA